MVWVPCLLLLFSLKVQADDTIYTQTFENNQTGNWTQTVGTMGIEAKDDQLVIQNTTPGSNVEACMVNADAPIQKNGEVLLDFFYEGQKNIALLFRASTTQAYQWQSFAYNGDGKWTFGEPGGKWITGINGPVLTAGQNYQLLVQYDATSIVAYLDHTMFYENQQVVYPNQAEISQWDGQVGLRLFGDRNTLKINAIQSGPVGSLTADIGKVDPENEAALKIMRDRWKQSVVGDFSKDQSLLNDTDVKRYIANLTTDSNELYQSLHTEQDRTTLWDRVPSDTNSANLTTQFKKIQTLAKAYATPNTDLYQNQDVLHEIQSALVFMTADGRYDGKKYYGNWWDWQIGVPQQVLPTLFIVYDTLPQELITKYATILATYLPNPQQQMYGRDQNTPFDITFIPNFSNTGANRTDQALSCLGIGILAKNPAKIKEAVTSIQNVFKIVTSGDGFYADGSFIQHTDIPYTGSYGNDLVKGVGKIFTIVSGTKWQLEDQIVDSFVANVENAFIPVIEKGETMPMVNGRSISRAPSKTKQGFGSPTLFNLLITAQFANASSKQHLQETAKYWMQQNLEYYLNNTRDFNDLMLTKQVLFDADMTGDTKPFVGNHMYSAMDRFVSSTAANTIGISMYSNRISAFEAINQENKKGWHTSDGMVYLYNDDLQFGSSYWPTVDFYRLPGTTVDTRNMADETTFKPYRSSANHVGGVTQGDAAAVAMQLDKKGSLNNGKPVDSDLQAKKSWFVLDGMLVNLGANIEGKTDASIETIIDNRLLDPNATYTFTDSQGENKATVSNQDVKKDSWYLLHSTKANESIGYYMLQDQNITTQLDARTGTYQAINAAFPSDTVYSGTYQKVIVNHGQEVTNGSYAYITYPNATKEQLVQLEKTQAIQVLDNTNDVQAVQDRTTKTLAANFWNPNGGSVAGIGLNKAMSVIVKTNGDHTQEISIANPAQTAEVVTITLPKKIQSIQTTSDKVVFDQAAQTITVDTSASLGAAFTFTVTYEEDSVPAEHIQVMHNSLEILKKNQTLALAATVSPANATDQELVWSVGNPAIATIENGTLVAKKPGTTTVTATLNNGVNAHFVIRVTP